MEVFFGYRFQEFVQSGRTVITENLLDRAVKAHIITLYGADYYRGLLK